MNPVTVIGVALAAVFSITSHEAAHGFVADRLGDPTARGRGRLTLNPVAHIDLFFTILLPLFLILSGSGFIFGGAKPVPVDVSGLRSPRRDWALVGAAGPLMNVTLAFVLTALLAVATGVGVVDPSSNLTEILAVGVFLNVLLAVFNLIPIPPLDGSRVVQYSSRARNWPCTADSINSACSSSSSSCSSSPRSRPYSRVRSSGALS